MFFILFLYHIFRFEFCIILLDSQAIATSELTHLHIAFSATSCPVRLFFAWKAGRVDRFVNAKKNWKLFVYCKPAIQMLENIYAKENTIA